MKKWIVKVNNEETTKYVNFYDAVLGLKEIIREHMEANEDVFDREGFPFESSSFFSYRYDEGLVTDEDIVVDTRLSMLCSAFMWQTPEESKDAVLRAIKKDIHYRCDNEEFRKRLLVDVNYLPNEAYIKITHIDLRDNEETNLESNALIFDDENKEYYFKSKQIITTSNKKELLGKLVELSVSLKPMD